MPGPRPYFEGRIADQVVSAIDAKRIECNGDITDALDQLAAQSLELFGRKTCARTLRRVWDERRQAQFRALQSGDPVRLAELQASQSEAAKLNLERATKLGEKVASMGGVPASIPGGRPESLTRKSISAEGLKQLALVTAAKMLDAASDRARDPETQAKDVAELVTRCGNLAVQLNTLVEEEAE